MSEEVSRSDHIDFFYVEDRVLAGDLHKAVEAQGRIAIAAIRDRLNANIPEGDLAAISAWLDVLAAMLACQGNPTRDCSDVVLYSDGSPVFRLIPNGTADMEARDHFDDSDSDNDIGDVAEDLATSLTGYKVQVNDPPVQPDREPSGLLSRLLER